MKKKITQISDRTKKKSALELKKEQLHSLIDNITLLDYVELSSRWIDIGVKGKLVHQLFIEKNGNIIVKEEKILPDFDFD